MLTRIGLMFVVVASLCGASFTLGTASSGARQESGGIPPEHPVMLALRYQQELALTEEQTVQITNLRNDMSKEFAPLREQAESIQKRMQELQQSGNPDPATVAQLKQQGEALGAKMQPVFERYAQNVGKILTDQQRQKLTSLSAAASPPPSEGKDFVLDTIMRSRDQLGITPQQFTKLQYLLADFIRAFAPVREKMELLQLEIKSKSGKDGQPPAPENVQRATDIQKQVAALQSQFSDQAARDVLNADQRAKLEELLHGEHRSAPTGG